MRSLLLGAAMVALMAPAAFAQSMDGADAPIMEGPGRYLVFFPWDKATLTADDQRIVAQAAEEFRRTGSARIDVTGYTDTSGSAEYNLRLSERRAQMVASELERQGIPRPRWSSSAAARKTCGSRRPTACARPATGGSRSCSPCRRRRQQPEPVAEAAGARADERDGEALHLRSGRPLRPQFRRVATRKARTTRPRTTWSAPS